MSRIQNLHRILGARFTHYKPNLCPGCKHFDTPARLTEDGWYGACLAKGTILCCERSSKGRCAEREERG